MSSLFDRLENELGDRNDEGGISPLDLLDLPDQLRRIMRAMLRATKLSHKEIIAHMEAWPEKDRMSAEDLESSLDNLVKQGWLIVMGEDDYIGYRVNLRRKKGKKLSDSIWGALENKIEDRIEQQRKLADRIKAQSESKRPGSKENDAE